MAGGKGTRMAAIAPDIPKPMLPVCGKPVLQHQIEALARQGHTDIVLIIGHLGAVIRDFFGNGERFGVRIQYWQETEPRGTAGALFECGNMLVEDDFLLLCGDILFDIDFERFIHFHYTHNALATLASHPNNHPYDSGILETDKNGTITGWLAKEDDRRYYKNTVNAGLHIVSKELLALTKPASPKVDLDRDLLKKNIATKRLFAYNTPEYIKDMGTPERLAEAEHDVASGIPALRNLAHKQRAVFLDRDGTLNALRHAAVNPLRGFTSGVLPSAKLPEENKANDPETRPALAFVTRPEELVLIDGAAEAVRAINESGLLAIVITNQPVIARGQCTFETLDMIHKKLETDLGKEGAYINDLYFCPHHPHKGFAGEVAAFKTDCGCRKPKAGMLLAAAEKYNIDLAASWMVGDSFRDVGAGKNAGCKTAFINNGGNNSVDTGADIIVTSAAEAVAIILKDIHGEEAA
jgi:D-glycero-D-manno-heptose 1,7-bisphosphate phosphatase